MTYLVLFDGECALCNRAVRWIMQRDRRKLFTYRPLPKDADQSTLVLVEGKHTWKYGKGALRILWLLGGWWKVVGVLHFLPGWLINSLYKLIARHRHLL